ncbi:MAG: hypothetical protein VZS44_00815 [Bacilli bacterium]|nr:hypothetical protein [Bacilli bacterium]
MDEAMENRFGYYREKTDEELENEREVIINDMEYLESILSNKDASSEQKSEIKNSDLKFEREKLKFINNILEERNVKVNKRSIHR